MSHAHRNATSAAAQVITKAIARCASPWWMSSRLANIKVMNSATKRGLIVG